MVEQSQRVIYLSFSLQTVITTDLKNLPVNNALLQLVSNNSAQGWSVSSNVSASNASSIANNLHSSQDLEPSSSSTSTHQQNDTESISVSIQNLDAEQLNCYNIANKCIEELALYLKPFTNGNIASLLSRPMQRKLVTLINCQLVEDEGRSRALRAARSLGERTVTELILQHQNPQQLSANLWATVRARGCQFLGPAMQEEVLKLVLLALEDGSALSRKVLVMFVVQRLEPHFPQASKTSIGHVVQLLYRASCFKVSKREGDSSLMQLKEEFRTYDALRREHDAQIVQIATEAGLRIAPDQWSALLYGDTAHKSHMQSIIDKLQTPQSFAQSVQELVIALQRTNDPANLAGLRVYLKQLTNIDPTAENTAPSWQEVATALEAVKKVVNGLVEFVQHHGNRKLQDSTYAAQKYKISMCRDLALRAICPRGANCTFAHSEEELEKYRAKNRKLHARTPILGNSSNTDTVDYLTDHSHNSSYSYISSSTEDMPSRYGGGSSSDKSPKLTIKTLSPNAQSSHSPFEQNMYTRSSSSLVPSPNLKKGHNSSSQSAMNLLHPTYEPTIHRRSFESPTVNYAAQMEHMNVRHLAPPKYQANIPVIYPTTNVPQAMKFNANDAYGKPHVKSIPSPHLRSPQHPTQQVKYGNDSGLDGVRMNESMRQNMSYDQHMHSHHNLHHHQNQLQHQHSRQHILTPMYQTPNQIKPKGHQHQSNSTSPHLNGHCQAGNSMLTNSVNNRANLELRRQEILRKLKQYKEEPVKHTNGNKADFGIATFCKDPHTNNLMSSNNLITKNNNNNNNIINNNNNNNNNNNSNNGNSGCSKDDLLANYWSNSMASNEFRLPTALLTNNNCPEADLNYTSAVVMHDNRSPGASNAQDIFVRSDSILTDDDYIPFEEPTQSKYGPISRMSAKTSPYSSKSDSDAATMSSQSFFNESLSTVSVTVDNMQTLSSISMSPETNTSPQWLYENMQNVSQYNYKMPNELSQVNPIYQSTISGHIDPILGDTVRTEGMRFCCLFCFELQRNSKNSVSGSGGASIEDEQNVLTMELQLIEQKLMRGNSVIDRSKVILIKMSCL